MKKFNELTLEELKLVFQRNSKLQSAVFEECDKQTMYWIEDYMRCFEAHAVDYEFCIEGIYV